MLEAGLYEILPLELVRGVSVGHGAVGGGGWGLVLDIDYNYVVSTH